MTKGSRNGKEVIKMPTMSHPVNNTTVIISYYHNNWCSLNKLKSVGPPKILLSPFILVTPLTHAAQTQDLWLKTILLAT